MSILGRWTIHTKEHPVFPTRSYETVQNISLRWARVCRLAANHEEGNKINVYKVASEGGPDKFYSRRKLVVITLNMVHLRHPHREFHHRNS
jgi:hypothetical protein